MPPPADDMWFRPFAAGSIFFGTFFVFLSNDYMNFYEAPPVSFWISMAIAFILGVLIYIFTEREKAPSWSIVFSLITFVLSIVWIGILSGVIVDFIGLLGIVFQIDPAYLGITILAWSASIGDMVANCSIAK